MHPARITLNNTRLISIINKQKLGAWDPTL